MLECVSPKIAIFTTFFVSPGDAPGAITLNVVSMGREFDAYKLSRWMCPLTITVSQIERYIGRKSSCFHTPLHSTPPLGEFPSEWCHDVWYEETRIIWLGYPTVKIRLFVFTWSTNVTDRHTEADRHIDTAWRHRPRLCIASRGKNLTVLIQVIVN